MAEMRRYKLLAGGYRGPDYTAAPLLDAEGNPTAYPPKSYKRGDTVRSEINLLGREGPERWQDLGPEPKFKNAIKPKTGKRTGPEPIEVHVPGPREPLAPGQPVVTSAAPGGQVAQGHQGATGLKPEQTVGGELTTVSGPLDPEKVKELHGGGDEEDTDDEEMESEGDGEDEEDEEDEGVHTADTLKTMDLKELKELAAEEKVNIQGATTKDAIIKKIMASNKK